MSAATTYYPPPMRARVSWIEAIAGTLLFSSFVMLLARQAIAAPIRFYIPQAWYLPDLIMAAAAAAGLLIRLLQGKAGVFIGIVGFLAWMSVSSLYLELQSLLYAFRIFLALLVSYLAARHAGREHTLSSAMFLIVLSVANVGMLLDANTIMPWASATFSGAFGEERSISGQWWMTDGTRRLAGFGIFSTDSALVIAPCALLLSGRGGLNGISGLLALAVGGLSMYTLSLTQQKATTAWFVMIWLVAVVLPIIVGSKNRHIITTLMQAGCLSALFFCCMCPFIFYEVDLGALVGAEATSLRARTFEVWPLSIDRFYSLPTFLIGDGFGSVGEAARFTDARLAIPPDNMFLNLAITCGLFSFFLLFWVVRSITRAHLVSGNAIPTLAVMMFLILNGITANVIGGTSGMIVLGYALGLLHDRTRPPRSLKQSTFKEPTS